ncbi:extracellular solute-binding protein [Phytoactinopolyspora alkaliphila]|uniref:Extracellular solute-binding protein n=1 Tax=Phytoactinopolyspora alkaliphila TaxID=1783498 RepID=A0A6N9YKH4_9ACTN|nr:extracellular solute-binding protein [Phytoactinopolyspora alkaliphila]NED95369.1 extracellular solute-binding protein [Phytoactinopolyspora alkaliphila]
MNRAPGTHNGATMSRAQFLRLGGLTAAGVAAPGFLSGCSAFTGQSSEPGDDATASGRLTMMISPEQTTGLEEIFDAFESETGITLERGSAPVDSLNEQLRIQITSGTAKDMFRSAPGGSVPSAQLVLGREGSLRDLSDQPWAGDVPDAFGPLLKDGDALYGFPISRAAIVIVYNKAVFSDLGAEPPTTWSEFLAVGDELKAADITPITFGLGNIAYIQFMPYALVCSLVNRVTPDIDEQLAAGTATFSDTPGWREALEKFKLLIDEYTDASPLGIPNDQAMQAVARGDAGMIPIISSNFPIIEEFVDNAEEELGAFVMPATDNPDDTWVPSSPDSLSVNADAANPEAALQLLEFLARPEHVTSYNERTQSFPGLVGNEVIETIIGRAVAPYLDAQRAAPYANHPWPNGEVQQTFMQTGQQYVEGSVSLDELLGAMDDAYAKGSE